MDKGRWTLLKINLISTRVYSSATGIRSTVFARDLYTNLEPGYNLCLDLTTGDLICGALASNPVLHGTQCSVA